MFALEASERINMGARRSHSVIFAASVLIITLSLLFFPPTSAILREGGRCFLRVDACTGMICAQEHTHRARSSN